MKMKNTRLIIMTVSLLTVVMCTALLIRSRQPNIREEKTRAPERSFSMQKLGHAYSAMAARRDDLAEKILLDLLRAEKDNAAALRMLGSIYYRSGRIKQAEKLFLRLAENAGDASSYNNLGLAYMRQGRHAEALTVLQKAEEMNPESPEIQLNLYQLYQLMDKPELSAAHLARGRALMANGGAKWEK